MFILEQILHTLIALKVYYNIEKKVMKSAKFSSIQNTYILNNSLENANYLHFKGYWRPKKCKLKFQKRKNKKKIKVGSRWRNTKYVYFIDRIVFQNFLSFLPMLCDFFHQLGPSYWV